MTANISRAAAEQVQRVIQRGEINGLPLSEWMEDVLPFGRDEP